MNITSYPSHRFGNGHVVKDTDKMEGKMLDKLDVFETRVRERAFRLWEEAGCPDNSADEFWHRGYGVCSNTTQTADARGPA